MFEKQSPSKTVCLRNDGNTNGFTMWFIETKYGLKLHSIICLKTRLWKIQAKSPKVCHSVGDIFIFLRVEENSGKQIVTSTFRQKITLIRFSCHTFPGQMSDETRRKQTQEILGSFKTTLMLTEKCTLCSQCWRNVCYSIILMLSEGEHNMEHI